ncbi:unnamed protein product [Nippostrongylus brasiliensis]|uniref:Uncharacterized protein n=1 Tax=Nippostrongylus brasiliensis TaxID=27835 RepID=A0A0N4XYD6_NIPBR|nr:unnamed protein product [Nippostrongylus brasiliensis]
MRLRTALLLALVVVLAIGCDGAREKSRKKNRDKSRADDSELGEEGGRGFRDEGLTNKERERERERERLLEKGERKKEEEESSEEDDDDKKEKNATNTDEIVIPEARFRRSHYDESRVRSGLRYKRFKNEGENSMGTVQMTRSKELNDGKSILLEDVQNKPAYKPRLRRTKELVKAQELYDGEQQPLEKRPTQTHQRHRRTKELVKAQEINDGEQKPLEKRPTQTHQQRFRRWPLPSKRTNHRQLHKKLGDSGKKKTKVQANHRARRLRRAEQEYEPEQSLTPMSKSESTDETSSSEERPKTRRVRSFANRGLIPRGKPSPYDTQSEEVLERDKTLKSIYPFQFL